MHGCMSERVICNHPRADGRIAVISITLVIVLRALYTVVIHVTARFKTFDLKPVDVI